MHDNLRSNLLMVADATAQQMAVDAAVKFLEKVLTFSELHNHVGGEWCELSAHLEHTRLAHVTDPDDRKCGAGDEASFMIGLAIGRRMSGA
jgi:hypothetical protein